MPSKPQRTISSSSRSSFRQIAHCGFALLLAVFLAGCGSGIHSPLFNAPPTQPPPTDPPPTPTQSGSITIVPQYAALFPGQSTQFSANAQTGVQWEVGGIVGGNATVGTIDASGKFTAPSTLSSSSNVIVTAALAASPTANFASAVMALIASGNLVPTANPQVADYSLYLPAPGSMSVNFGKDANYGFPTSLQVTPTNNGGAVHVLVAGMLGSTAYHMQAHVTLGNGATATDRDHTITTGAAPTTTPLTITPLSGQSPQPGIQLFDTVVPHTPAQVFATDLQGNVLWTYTYTDGTPSDLVYPVRLLPNGHFLVLISYASSAPAHTAAPPPSGTIDVVREVDLAGTTIRELSLATLNAALKTQAATNFHVQALNLLDFHHDVLPLPNGHFIVLANLQEACASIPGCNGTATILGDALIDLDENYTPVWTWNSFDHLDTNRRPMLFPDWTHSNAILYSKDDQNLLLSIRHQNWIIKIDYQNGQGDGHVIWHLGHQGDFKLVGGVAPTDWFYAQHGPNYFTQNTTGIFQIGVLDNGNDRRFPAGVTCGTGSAPPCHYSTAMVLKLDESAKTATFVHHYIPQPYEFDMFGGNVDLLANGDVEADFCGVKTGSIIDNLDYSGGSAQLVWQATTPGSKQYRSFRLPSLYPGVQWP
ncbi:MAG: aryl-sulfate sulfotransferase [Acidobacteriaceae bacterium]